MSIDKLKKTMKKSKKETVDHSPAPVSSIDEKKSKKDSKKKRKALAMAADDDKDKPNIELESEVKQKTKKKSKKAQNEKEKEKEKEQQDENPNAVSKFRISQTLKDKLKEKGIESLLPIQAKTFDTILDGFDLIGQARTGQGKSLAYVLPMLESLAKEPKKTGYRAPSVLVILPTRNLAIQVLKDIGFYCGALGLLSCCVYGGSSHASQEKKLKRGADIIVGTPGRVKEQIKRGNIDLSALKFRVLDDAEELSKKDFIDEVEFILGKVNDVTKVQTLIFSATRSRWVDVVAPSKYLKSNYKEIELASHEERKTGL